MLLSEDHGATGARPPGATETSWPRLLQTSMSGSFVLPQLVSVLMSLAYDATKGHTAVQGLGHTMLVSVLCCQPGQVFLSGQCCQLSPCESFGSWVSGPQKSPMESKESKSKTQTDQQTNKQTSNCIRVHPAHLPCQEFSSQSTRLLMTSVKSFSRYRFTNEYIQRGHRFLYEGNTNLSN